MNILIVDNYDSFTYNLVHLLERISGVQTTVIRNDSEDLDSYASFDRVVLSPGPGLPSDAGRMPAFLKSAFLSKPVLGVCLGQQAIAECFGGSLRNLGKVMHGLATDLHVIDAEDALFKGLPRNFKVMHYHSWVVDEGTIPSCLRVTAKDHLGNIMSLRHEVLNYRGVQFHPESVLTEHGKRMMENWLDHC
jgi:anthranilate synthase component 2